MPDFIPKMPPLFQTSLAFPFAPNDTTFTLASDVMINGVRLSGLVCASIDIGQPNPEYVIGILVSNVITVILRNVNPLDPRIAGPMPTQTHRRGAVAKITDFASIQIMRNILNGDQPLDNIIRYTQSQNFTDPLDIVDKEYVDGIFGGGVVPPNVGTPVNGNSGTTQVTNQIISATTSGSDRFILLKISMESAQTATVVTYGGTPMVFVGARNQGNVRVEVWKLVNPSLGTNNVSITLSGASLLEWDVLPFNAVDQTTPFVLGSTNGGNTTTSTGSISTDISNAILVHALATKLIGISYTAGTDESIVSQSTSGSVQGAIQIRLVSDVDTYTSNITLSSANDWANVLGFVRGIASTVVGGSTVKATSADTTPGFLDPKIEIVSADDSVTIVKTIQNPGANEKISYDLSVILGGGSGSGTGNLAEQFDDFINDVTIAASGSSTATFRASGNFAWQDISGGGAGFDAVTEDGHPGIVSLTNSSQQALVGFYDRMMIGSTPTNGLLNFTDDFDIKIYTRLTYTGTDFGAIYKLNGSTDSIGFEIGAGDVLFDDGSGPVSTGASVPVSGTWVVLRMVNIGGALTAYIDSVQVFSGTLNASNDFGIIMEPSVDTDLTSMDVDWVRTVYRIIENSNTDDKKVGVGSSSNTQWFNMQPLFDDGLNWVIGDQFGPMSAVITGGNEIHAPGTAGWLLYNFTESEEYDFNNVNKKKIIVEGVCIVGVDNQDAGWGIGTTGAAIGALNEEAFGFIRNAGVWYAYVGDGTTHTKTAVTVSGSGGGTKNVFRIEYNPATPSALFYIDGVLVATITTTFPTVGGTGVKFQARNNLNSPIQGIGCPSFAVEI